MVIDDLSPYDNNSEIDENIKYDKKSDSELEIDP